MRRPHEPAELTLTVRRGDGGRLLLTVPVCPGWGAAVRTPQELALAVERAWAEVQCAAYAAWRGVAYDLLECATETAPPPVTTFRHPEEPDPAPDPADEVGEKRRKRHPRTHEPTDWRELSDGRWLSPAGRRYQPGSRQVQAVIAAMGARGATG